MKTKTEFQKIKIPTYEVGKPEDLPIFFEKRANQGASSKIYPMPYTDKITDNKVDKEYNAAVLENEYIKVVTLPSVGGKIYSALDKTNGYDFVYHNKVIKPAMIALAGPWVSGGIEFNWPLHHRPTTYDPTDVKIVENGDGEKTVWMSEVEPYNRTKGMVGITVPSGRSYIRADVRIYNGTPIAHPFLWWANLATEIDDTYEVQFPPDVEYVNDHDRRAVISWPIAKGRFATARPYDYGTGVNLKYHRNIIVPSSFMIAKGQSDADFICGYNRGKESGTVSVANHYIAPGKKLWTWANNNFGYRWCANLTDDGSRYVELMSGCYTDNQPDFTYIQPYETKTFTQYWYPVRDIGGVKNATIDAAVNLEEEGEGVKLGFYATGVFNGCRITLKENGVTVYETVADLSPEKTFLTHLPVKFAIGLSAELCDGAGNRLVEYTVKARGGKEPIAPREISPRPKDIATVEELYLHGRHIVQYKHFTYVPDDYYLEGLRRDPYDSRCNEGMGDLKMERGQFEEAIAYYDKAEKRLELRNANPEHTDVLYKRGLCKSYLGDVDGAYQDFYWSTWSYKNRSAGYYGAASLASKKGDKAEAVRLLKLSLQTDTQNLWAKKMICELSGDKTILAEIEGADPLFDAFRTDDRQALDFAVELIKFGLYARAEEVLKGAEESVMNDYYLAYLNHLLGREGEASSYKARGEGRGWETCKPNRLQDIAVLQYVNTARANYYLGCLYYDKDRYADAAECFEACIRAEEFYPAYRALALAYYDHLDRKEEARTLLTHALELAPDCDRIFYELTQLYKNSNCSISERLELYRRYRDNAVRRDDCTLEYAQLLTVTGELKKAKEVLTTHRFHTYEGGEGNLTSFHAWLQMLLGEQLERAGKREEAYRAYEEGLTFPANYGEEKSFFVNDAPLYLGMSRCTDDENKKKDALEKACHTYGDVSPHTIWQASALTALGRKDEAQALINKMLETAGKLYADRDMPPYFGVGSHAFMPFSYDTEKYFTLVSMQLEGYARYCTGERAKAEQCYGHLMKIDCGDFVTNLLGKLLHE